MSWFVWYFQPRFREAVKPFEEKYGIKVTIPEGNFDGNFNKLIAEKSRPAGDIDVMATGSGQSNTIKPADLFYPLKDLLPDAAKLRDKIGGVDSGGYAYAYWGNQTGIAYNPAKIAEADLPQSHDAIAAFVKGHPGEFGLNYENGGSGPAFIQAVATNLVTGVDFHDGATTDEKVAALAPVWDWFKALGEDYVITASNVDTLVRINDGELAMGPAWEDHLAGLQAKGEIPKKIKYYIPKFGTKGDGNYVAIPKNAPHPAATVVFIEWLLSAETQTNSNKTFGSVPMNPDASDKFALVSSAARELGDAGRRAVRQRHRQGVHRERRARALAPSPPGGVPRLRAVHHPVKRAPMDIKLSRIAGPIIAHRGACMDYPENTIADETVPLLTTALDTCLAHDIALVLEIKATWGWDAEDALVVADVVNDRWPHDSANLVVTSFSAPAIAAFAKRVPWARCGLATLAPPRDPAALMRDLGIVAVHLDYHYLGPGDVDRLRDAGAEVAVATVNDAAIGQGLLDAGAQGLITDHPRLL